MKFTFKKQPRETGLAGVAHPYPNTDIKAGSKVVGEIVAPTWRTPDNKWHITLSVKDEDRLRLLDPDTVDWACRFTPVEAAIIHRCVARIG